MIDVQICVQVGCSVFDIALYFMKCAHISISTGSEAEGMCPDYFSLSGKLYGELPILFWFHYFEITVMSCHKSCSK